MIISDVMDINFYRLNSEYRKIKDEIGELKKGIYDLDVLKINAEKKLLDLNERLRKIEIKIMNDLEKRS